MAESKSRERAPIAVVLIVLLVLLPCVYVLSIGPVWYLLNNGFGAWVGTASVFYWPLNWCCEHSSTVNAVISSYQYCWYPSSVSEIPNQ